MYTALLINTSFSELITKLYNFAMTLNDDFKIKILFETDADLYKLVEHVDTTTESLDMKNKHEILVLTEKRCQKSVCSRKILHVAA